MESIYDKLLKKNGLSGGKQRALLNKVADFSDY
jgi:hypothetical protein